MVSGENKGIQFLIEELKSYDNEEGYKLSYQEVKKKLDNTIRNLVTCGEECVEYLHQLLPHEETWSCLFALEILKEIKSEKSIPWLIDFIKRNENGDWWESCEEAMYALSNIGDSAVEPLLATVRLGFENENFFTFLVEALTSIKNEKVYSFMTEVTEKFLKNHEKYRDWFNIGLFTYEFDKQEKKEVIPLLKKLLEIKNMDDFDRYEIEDTIKIIEDPVKFKKEMDERLGLFKPVLKGEMKNIGRNDPCPCGSGKKYKKCCLRKQSRVD